MANTMSKSELIQRIVEGHPNEIARKDVKGVIEGPKLATRNSRRPARS